MRGCVYRRVLDAFLEQDVEVFQYLRCVGRKLPCVQLYVTAAGPGIPGQRGLSDDPEYAVS